MGAQVNAWIVVVALAAVAGACRSKSSAPDDAGAGATSSASASAVASAPKPPPTNTAPPDFRITGSPPESSEPVSAKKTGPPVIDEVKTIEIDGVTETWSLVWRHPPDLTCADKAWNTCPCGGFAFGQTGELDLVRKRPGEPDDKLDLNKLSEDPVELQRWAPTKADRDKDDPPSPEEIKKRPRVTTMKFGDFDHDGRETEFLFRVGLAGGCGHTSYMIPIGISTKNPKLHMFQSVERQRPIFNGDDWEKVRTLKGDGPLKIITLQCGDHGSEEEEWTTIRFDADGFHTKNGKRRCPPVVPVP